MAAESFAAGRPMVVMFSLRGCPWCDALRREHFTGLIAAQQRLGILAVEIDMTDSHAFASPQQTPTPASLRADSPRELSRHYRVRLAPTVLFLGPDGEVAERLVGYGSPDFFGAYLDQRIAQARSALRASPPRTPTQ
jgi:thioredoxin-related protein